MKVCRMHYRDYITIGGRWPIGKRGRPEVHHGAAEPTEAVSHSVSSVGQKCLHKAKYRHGQMFKQDEQTGNTEGRMGPEEPTG